MKIFLCIKSNFDIRFQLQQRTREISDAINLLEQVDRDPSRVVDLVNVFQVSFSFHELTHFWSLFPFYTP